MFMAKKTHAKIMPTTAKMDMIRNRVTEILDGSILRKVRSTGGEFPPEDARNVKDSQPVRP